MRQQQVPKHDLVNSFNSFYRKLGPVCYGIKLFLEIFFCLFFNDWVDRKSWPNRKHFQLTKENNLHRAENGLRISQA
jgi:hypothetical protein